MAVSFIGIIMLVALVGIVILGTVVAVGSLRKIRLGHVKLNCPHCGKETTSHLGTCQQCGKEL